MSLAPRPGAASTGVRCKPVTATALLGVLRRRGVTLEPVGDRLRFRPREAVTPDLRMALVAHKAELLGLLRESAPARCSWSYAFPWPNEVPGLGPRRVQPFSLCAECGTGTWVAYGGRPLCLACARKHDPITGD